jgi:hypothetical protein
VTDDRDDFWAAVDAVDWGIYPVPAMLRRLLSATDLAEAGTAESSMFESMGSYHSGDVQPVFLTALPFLIRVALEGPAWPQTAALGAIEDALELINLDDDCGGGLDPSAVIRCLESRREALVALASEPRTAPQVQTGVRRLLERLTEAARHSPTSTASD